MAGKVVRVLSAGMLPHADCLEPGCPFTRSMSGTTRAEAKRHVRGSGHSVVVTTEKRDVYEMGA